MFHFFHNSKSTHGVIIAQEKTVIKLLPLHVNFNEGAHTISHQYSFMAVCMIHDTSIIPICQNKFPMTLTSRMPYKPFFTIFLTRSQSVLQAAKRFTNAKGKRKGQRCHVTIGHRTTPSCLPTPTSPNGR